MAVGTAQSITITGGGAISDQEIDKMVRDAESFAEADLKRKEEVELRNQADSVIYQAEKTIKDLGDKADKEKVDIVNKGVEELKEAVKGGDMELIKQKLEAVTQPLYELTTLLYQQKSEQQQPGADQTGDEAKDGKKDENVVDADYEVKEENADGNK